MWLLRTVVVLLLAHTVEQCWAQCNALTAADWADIIKGLGTENFFNYFNSSEQCQVANIDSLRFKYSNCTATLENTVTVSGLSENCRVQIANAFYRENGVITTDKANAEAIDICTRPVNTFISNYLCNPIKVPGCPTPAHIGKFAAVVNCLLKNETIEQRQKYFLDGEDKVCLTKQDFCTAFLQFQTCTLSMNDVIDAIYDNNLYECFEIFLGASDVNERCTNTLKSLYSFYCPMKTFLEENLVGLVVGIAAGLIALCGIGFFCYRFRSGHIDDSELIAAISKGDSLYAPQDDESANLGSANAVHPELAAVMEKKSKYKGITYDIKARMWRSNMTGQLFSTEMEAAQAAYYAQEMASPKLKRPLLAQNSSPMLSSQSSFSVTSSPPVAAYLEEPSVEPIYETPEEKKARRIRQLVHFYEYWDPEKDDIPGHAEHLFNRHNFTYIARAVKTKYGLMPPGWDEELEVEQAV